MLYRLLVSLATNPPLPEGAISALRGLSEEKRRVLVEKGRIAEVAPVPLRVFGPQWEGRLADLRYMGIETVVDLLSRDATELAELTPAGIGEITRWQDEVRGYLRL